MALPSFLLIDDNRTRVQQFESVLSFLEYQVISTNSADSFSVINELLSVRAVFIGNGCEKLATTLKMVLDSFSAIPVILLIDKGMAMQIPTAIQNMLTEYQEWPTQYGVFSEMLKTLPVPKNVQLVSVQRDADKGLAGRSQAITQIRALIDQVAKSSATVLVLGESGTGKEVVAQALHQGSGRSNRPFVPINCGAIPGELLESELFGHEKGAFTGALTARQGRFEMAEGGTLFLDEIGDMPMPMQVKLLRVLQERTFQRVGSNKTIECDVRIIAATHRNLENEIKEKHFREDLFYRLNVFPIEIPSLRTRVEDIPLLVNDLISRMQATNRDSVQFTAGALALMMQHPWPGNIRELSNFIERLAITNPNSTIDASDLPEKFLQYEVPGDMDLETIELADAIAVVDQQPSENGTPVISPIVSQLPEQGMDLKEYLNNMEVDLIQQALNECNGVVAHAAKLLNMRRTTLVEKLRKYELSS